MRPEFQSAAFGLRAKPFRNPVDEFPDWNSRDVGLDQTSIQTRHIQERVEHLFEGGQRAFELRDQLRCFGA